MDEPKTLKFYHDSDGLDYISAFAAVLKPLGVYVIDVTPDDVEYVAIIVTNKPPKEGQKEWEY